MTTIRLEMDATSATLHIEDFETASSIADTLYDALASDDGTFVVIDVNAEWESYNMPKQPDEPQVMILFSEPPTVENMAHLLKSLAALLG